MQRMPFIALSVMSMILVSQIPLEGNADDLKNLTVEQKVDKGSELKSESRVFFRKTLDKKSMMDLWQFQEDKSQFINLRERYPEKTAGKQVQEILELKNRKIRSHNWMNPQRYFINGVPASRLGYRLHQLNSPY